MNNFWLKTQNYLGTLNLFNLEFHNWKLKSLNFPSYNASSVSFKEKLKLWKVMLN